MNSSASFQTTNRNSVNISPTLINRLLSIPLRVGIWNEEEIDWIYPSTFSDKKENKKDIMSVTSMNSTEDYEIIKFQLENNSDRKRNIKVIVQYDNIFQKKSTAFYSPYENAIICYCNNQVSMIGGEINGAGMKQYSLQNRSLYSEKSLLMNLNQGKLPLNWIAKGDICSIFTLETNIDPGARQEGMIWTFHSESEDSVRMTKNKMIVNIF